MDSQESLDILGKSNVKAKKKINLEKTDNTEEKYQRLRKMKDMR